MLAINDHGASINGDDFHWTPKIRSKLAIPTHAPTTVLLTVVYEAGMFQYIPFTPCNITCNKKKHIIVFSVKLNLLFVFNLSVKYEPKKGSYILDYLIYYKINSYI